KKPRYIGDPINAVKIFNNKGVDELCILGISVTKRNSEIAWELLGDIATEAFMPLSYGGGIQTLDDVKRLFAIGYEKVIFNTAIFNNPRLIEDAVAYAGSQSIVASIDVKSNLLSKSSCWIQCGTKNTKDTPASVARKVESLGVGEILLNSIDRDGMMNGYDLNLVKSVVESVSIPVIACGGAGSIEDIKKVIQDGHAHAVAAGSVFVYYGRNRAILITYPGVNELGF
ncbi:MAG: imidazole glycerol phosphate synthase subunit HisF, partial [Clostridia bacterium]|nr:imidazole glycerol phosphate synthase subunit HisF [Clostridia bacterium]